MLRLLTKMTLNVISCRVESSIVLRLRFLKNPIGNRYSWQADSRGIRMSITFSRTVATRSNREPREPSPRARITSLSPLILSSHLRLGIPMCLFSLVLPLTVYVTHFTMGLIVPVKAVRHYYIWQGIRTCFLLLSTSWAKISQVVHSFHICDLFSLLFIIPCVPWFFSVLPRVFITIIIFIKEN